MRAITEQEIFEQLANGLSEKGIVLSPDGIELLKNLAKQEKTYIDAMSKFNFMPFAPDSKVDLSLDDNGNPTRIGRFFSDDPNSKVKFGIYEDSSCSHEWVDVGFSYSKMVCKKCNKDKT